MTIRALYSHLVDFLPAHPVLLKFISGGNVQEGPGHMVTKGAQMKLKMNGSIVILLVKLITLMEVSQSNALKKEVCSFNLILRSTIFVVPIKNYNRNSVNGQAKGAFGLKST